MTLVTKVFINLSLFLTISAYAQMEKVTLIESRQGRRLHLIAENKTTDTLNVFLMVNATGYRRSADKPVLTDLPPTSSTRLTTLVELANTTSSYTYDLIINERENDLEIAYANETRDILETIKDKVVVFRLTDCPKCDLLITMLEGQSTKHGVFDIEKDKALYEQFTLFINNESDKENKIRFPVIWNKEYAIYGYDDLQIILQEIDSD